MKRQQISLISAYNANLQTVLDTKRAQMSSRRIHGLKISTGKRSLAALYSPNMCQTSTWTTLIRIMSTTRSGRMQKLSKTAKLSCAEIVSSSYSRVTTSIKTTSNSQSMLKTIKQRRSSRARRSRSCCRVRLR